MTIERAEQLKSELTDKYVIVKPNVAELRRFDGLTGQVKTVNMNCRALVEFDGPEDIAWYDIDPYFLVVVDAPRTNSQNVADKSAEQKSQAASATKSTATKSAASSAAGLSPLELARQQGAASGTASAATRPADSAGKKLSPLELARQQGAAGSQPTSKPKPASQQTTPAPAAKSQKLSPLEQARQQDGGGINTPDPETKSDASANTPIPSPPKEVSQAALAPPTSGDANLSPLELARQQGAFRSGADGNAAQTSSSGSRATKSDSEATPAEPMIDLPRGVKRDDLKFVEGIGPKIAGLLNDEGIRTWAELAQTPVERIREILEAAGPRYRMHDPSSWPTQAGLAATGKWDDLQELKDGLTGGRA